MAKPQARTDEPRRAHVSAAPDNGVHMAAAIATHPQAEAAEPAAAKRRGGRQLMHRVPHEVYAALEQRAQQLGLTPGALVNRAIRSEVAGVVLPEDLTQQLAEVAQQLGTTPERVLAGAVRLMQLTEPLGSSPRRALEAGLAAEDEAAQANTPEQIFAAAATRTHPTAPTTLPG